MIKRNIMLSLVGIAILMLMAVPSATILPQFFPSTTKSVSSANITAAEFDITATVDIAAGMPIILKASDFALPYSKLQTAIVYDGGTPLLTQADDLNGDGIVDELVFLAPSPLSVGNTQTFTIVVKNEGLTNGQAPNAGITVTTALYNESYDTFLPAALTASHLNGSVLSPMVQYAGEVVWVDTTWGTVCMYVEAGYRQSGFKHIVLKDETWDVVNALYNATDDWRWEWSRFFTEADFGWHTGDTPDTVTISKVGPVRAVVQTLSGIGYNGPFGMLDTVHAARTYTFYENEEGIFQNLRLVGDDAEAASEDFVALYGGPLDIATKFIDQGFDSSTWLPATGSNNFSLVYSPNDPYTWPNNSRSAASAGDGKLVLADVTDPFFGVYNTTNHGFMVNWGLYDYKDAVYSIDWSDGEFDVKYAFDAFPMAGINRFLIPFSGSAVATTAPAFMDTANAYWTDGFEMQFTSYVDEIPPAYGVSTGNRQIEYLAADFDITASDVAFPVDYPIILKAADFNLPHSKLDTAIVYYAGNPLPTQADDLDGDGMVDEIVFLLDTAIPLSNTDTFTLKVLSQGMSNGQAANAGITVTTALYNESYDTFLPAALTASHLNGSVLSPMVQYAGEVVWVDTTWGTVCMYVEAGYRQSGFKHIVLKDETWDVVNALYNATDDWRWEWSRFFTEADFGWHTGDTPDTVTISKVGPVRAVVQTLSGIGYNGPFGMLDTVHAVRTYTYYDGFAGIYQNLNIAGADTEAAYEDFVALYGGPLDIATKFIDQGFDSSTWLPATGSNNFSLVYSPNDPYTWPNNSRSAASAGDGKLVLADVTDPFFGVYNTTNHGFMVNWGLYDYKDAVYSIDWSDGEFDVKYAFDAFPMAGINRFIIPFSGLATGGDAPAYMDAANGLATADYDLVFTSYLAEPWVYETTETETETTTTTETTTEIIDTTIYVNSTLIVDTTLISSIFTTLYETFETTFTESGPGFELLPILFLSILFFVRRRRK